MSSFDAIAERIRAHLNQKYEARERTLKASREVIRWSANAIRAVHRGELGRARELVASARTELERIRDDLAAHPDVRYAGFVEDAEKEFVEASAAISLVSGTGLPDPEDLGVSYLSYLHGLGDTVGELRRHLLDIIRRGEMGRGERILEDMEDIYSALVTMDYPDGMTGGLRRTTDVARSILEKRAATSLYPFGSAIWNRHYAIWSAG